MSDDHREQFIVHLSELCDEYGPWDVLWVTTQFLRPAFRKQEEQANADTPKRVRKGRDLSIHPGGDYHNPNPNNVMV